LRGGTVLITADHGNVEEMINLTTNQIDTEHSLNPVPLIVAGTGISVRHLPYGTLSDIAPTILSIMGIVKPAEMTGNSLIERI
jgi:2,3-bisphosphoglycerate-independent phosphoglycerate mutase